MALKKKVAAKRQAWNKGLEVGKKDAFTPAQVKRIRGVLADRGVSGVNRRPNLTPDRRPTPNNTRFAFSTQKSLTDASNTATPVQLQSR